MDIYIYIYIKKYIIKKRNPLYCALVKTYRLPIRVDRRADRRVDRVIANRIMQ